ncbi:MAG: hypothetical protein ACTH31_08320, partial [Pseudoclavibacter sp.]
AMLLGATAVRCPEPNLAVRYSRAALYFSLTAVESNAKGRRPQADATSRPSRFARDIAPGEHDGMRRREALALRRMAYR